MQLEECCQLLVRRRVELQLILVGVFFLPPSLDLIRLVAVLVTFLHRIVFWRKRVESTVVVLVPCAGIVPMPF